MKSDFERGPFGAWAFHSRDQLDISVEEVADRLGYHPASLRKVESGSAEPSRRIVRELPALYRTLATEKGVALSPAPAEEAPAQDTRDAVVANLQALTAAMTAQAEAMQEIVAEMRLARATDQGRTEGLAAALGDLASTLERLRLAPAGQPEK